MDDFTVLHTGVPSLTPEQILFLVLLVPLSAAVIGIAFLLFDEKEP